MTTNNDQLIMTTNNNKLIMTTNHDNSGECGMPGPSERIVGGEEATPHQYPWMAALFIDDKVN